MIVRFSEHEILALTCPCDQVVQLDIIDQSIHLLRPQERGQLIAIMIVDGEHRFEVAGIARQSTAQPKTGCGPGQRVDSTTKPVALVDPLGSA